MKESFCDKPDCDEGSHFCECQFCQAHVHDWTPLLERAEKDRDEAVRLLREQHRCYRVELGSPYVVCLPCGFIARVGAKEE